MRDRPKTRLLLPFWTRLLLTALVAAWATAPAAAVRVACHRMDNNRFAPENTYAAARRAVAMGYDYIEVDVRTSKDGAMYVIHDPYVDRTTDGKGALADLTSEQVDRLDAGSWFGEAFRGERVPRLEPFLRWAKGKIGVYLDPKDVDLAQLVRLVRDIGFREGECFFWPYAWDLAAELRNLDPDLGLIMNVRSLEEAERARNELRAQVIGVAFENLTPELVAFCRKNSMRVMVHEMRNDPDAFRKIIELGADLVNLDHPEVFLRIQEEMTGAPAGASTKAAEAPPKVMEAPAKAVDTSAKTPGDASAPESRPTRPSARAEAEPGVSDSAPAWTVPASWALFVGGLLAGFGIVVLIARRGSR